LQNDENRRLERIVVPSNLKQVNIKIQLKKQLKYRKMAPKLLEPVRPVKELRSLNHEDEKINI
jgi:hypothetical protein